LNFASFVVPKRALSQKRGRIRAAVAAGLLVRWLPIRDLKNIVLAGGDPLLGNRGGL